MSIRFGLKTGCDTVRARGRMLGRPLPRLAPVEAVHAALRINVVMLPCSIIVFRCRGLFVRDIL
jgi:hypothetical protein